MSQKIRVGINGFGRIGRLLFRHGFDRMDIVGVNNGSGSPSSMAHVMEDFPVFVFSSCFSGLLAFGVIR